MKKINKKQVKEFLNSEYVMQMATSSKKNIPRVSVVLFVVDKEMNFYFVTHRGSQKTKNINDNPNVNLAIWKHNIMLVQVSGRAKEMKREKDKLKVIDALAKAGARDKNFWAPLLRISGEEYSVYKISSKNISALDLMSKNMTEKKSPFTKIK